MIFNAVSLQPWVAAFSGGKQKSMIGMHASLDGLQEHALKTPVLSQQAVILAERAADLLVLTGSFSEEPVGYEKFEPRNPIFGAGRGGPFGAFDEKENTKSFDSGEIA